MLNTFKHWRVALHEYAANADVDRFHDNLGTSNQAISIPFKSGELAVPYD
jgi:hypothetical protein